MSLYLMTRRLGCRLENSDWCPTVHSVRSTGQVSCFFFRLLFLVDVHVSWWNEWMKDVVWRLALFMTTTSSRACDMLLAVRDSRILMRDSRLLLSLVICSKRSTVLVRSEMVVLCFVTVSSKSTRSLFMCLRLILCVTIFSRLLRWHGHGQHYRGLDCDWGQGFCFPVEFDSLLF